jgi:hypothetical protein
LRIKQARYRMAAEKMKTTALAKEVKLLLPPPGTSTARKEHDVRHAYTVRALIKMFCLNDTRAIPNSEMDKFYGRMFDSTTRGLGVKLGSNYYRAWCSWLS